jgi:hypothetical protein
MREVPLRRFHLVAIALLLCAGPAMAAETWAPLAEEFAFFTLAQPTTVRYGIDTRWTTVQMQPGTYPCHYGQFTDPAQGVFGKKCEQLVITAEPVTPPVTPPATRPARFKPWPIDPDSTRVFTKVTLELDPAFAAVWFKLIDGKWHHEGFSGRASELAENAVDTGMAVLKGGAASFDELWAANMGPDQTDPTLSALYAALVAAKRPADPEPVVVPPAPTYTVAVNGDTPDRPVVRLTASGTSAVSIGGVRQRIAVGQPCGLWSGRTSYYRVTGQLSTTGVLLPDDVYASCRLVQ